MNANTRAKRVISLLLSLIMVIGLIPQNVFAADSEPIVLIAGGDYQQAGDHENSSENVTDILNAIVDEGVTDVDGFLFIGDYDCETHDSSSETAAGIESLMDTVSNVYTNLDYDNTILVQGNHDYPDSRIDSTGGHDFNGYSVFVMNEDDYPNYGGTASQAEALAEEMDAFLAEKLEEGYTAPIFVTSHVPLHFGPRTNKQGDGKYASYVFDVLNAYGAEGLNIIFMHGHNHAYGYDEYLGGEAIYLAVGDKINIAQTGSQSSYNTYTLNFTYMNAGYTGYYNESGYSTSSGTDFLTMTTFEIYEDKVVIGRYSADGIYNLKTAGEKKGDYISSVSVSANTDTYASTQTVVLNAPAERITLEDAATGVTVTGLKVDGTFDDDSDLTVSTVESVTVLNDTTRYSAYQAYNTTFAGPESVKVTIPVPASYDPDTTKVYYVQGTAITDMEATISTDSGETVASFTATYDGTYAVVDQVVVTDAVYYERVESVSDLVSGEQYLIIFDCSSQTTADAIVIPEIATYSSGSSRRKGPDVIVSDGIGDDDTINGDYDAYLWTLTRSGSGWLIGNGSQNINVTYSSTSSRCELAFTTSGEALTIAAASSNPSDADSDSYAIYDNSGYYWQYNTTAALIYGTNGDSYISRFCFYKRVENADADPGASEGWISLTSEGVYTLDTDGIEIGEDHKYIIVGSNSNYALTLSGSTIGAVRVSVDGNTLTVEDPSSCEFYFADNSSKESGSYLLTQDGTKSVYHANGNMYYGSDNKGYWHFGSASNGSYQIYDNDNLSWYLNYGYVWSSDAVSRFAVSSNARSVRLYTSAGTYARLAGKSEQTYGSSEAATVASILESIYIELSKDGRNLTGTAAVTASMIDWDTAFNGNAAGTYTGTVTYEGKEMGTITVTVTNDHSYKAVVVEPTCTEGGYTIHTCSDCGDSYITDETDALGHDYKTVTLEPTCTEGGYTAYTCAVCGDSYVADYTEALGHSYETVTAEPTCTEAGSVTYACACGHSYTEIVEATGHSYTGVVTVPTCTEAGYTTYTCDCGDSYVADYTEALGHSYETVTVEPTCTEEGSVTYTCHCGHSYTEIIVATGHSYTGVVTVPTCTEAGCTIYTCSDCGDSYVADYTDALGHDYETVTVEPTCTEGGYTTDTCTVCGDGYIYDETDALGHDHVSVTVEPTCTEGGYTTYTCTVCGDSYVADETDDLGHSNTSVVTEATCEKQGYTTHTCTVCGTVSVDGYVAALGHAYETVRVEATCTENGSVTSTCTVCGDSYHAVIEAVGHDYATVVTAPTCTEDGGTTYTCVNCDHSYAEVIEAIGHSYQAVVTGATCTEGGYTTYTCDHCGDSYVGDETAAVGHTYSGVVTAPTCTEGGYTTYTCIDCGDSYIGNETEALGHTYSGVVTAPTCTEGGYTTYTCIDCGDSYVGNETAALGHSYSSVVTEATCTEGGYTTHTCDHCGDSYVTGETEALGHTYSSVVTAATCTEGGYTTHTCEACGDSYVDSHTNATGHSYTCVESDGYLVYTCDHCGDSYSEEIETEHTYSRVTAISSGNEYVITLYSGRKYYALSHEGNEISVVQVTVSNGEITSEITEDLVWTYSDRRLSYEDNGTTYYLYAGSSSNNWWDSWFGNWWGSSGRTLSLSTSSSSTVSFSNSRLKVGSYYLRYSGGSVSLNSSATTTYIFVEE